MLLVSHWQMRKLRWQVEVSFLVAYVLCARFVDGAKVECGALERDELVLCLSFHICTVGVW